jgi:LysM repeat protein
MKRVLSISAFALLLSCAPARAAVHVIAPGETLSSVAATDALPVAALAEANGVSPDARLVAGRTLVIPAGTGAVPAGARGAMSTAPERTTSGGGYTVRPGDTLLGLAARAGVPASELASINGLSPSGLLRAGAVVRLPTASSTTPTASSVETPAAPVPTDTRVTAEQIGTIARANGVPPALAEAVGWQESGFDNQAVSSASARGVMQIMPGTWGWIQAHLAQSPLNPASAADNIRAGVLYLGALLRRSGGNPETAIADYYQGAGSVDRVGLLPSTRRYVEDVTSLTRRFR